MIDQNSDGLRTVISKDLAIMVNKVGQMEASVRSAGGYDIKVQYLTNYYNKI